MATLTEAQKDDQDHRAHQHQQHRPDITNQRLLQRLHLNRPVGSRRIVGGIFCPQLRRESIQPGLRQLRANSRLQKPYRSGRIPHAVIRFREGIGLESHCCPYFNIRRNRSAWMAESRGKNTDNRVGIIVELYLSPQNSRISAKPAGPQAVADHDRFCETRHVVAQTKHPSDVRGSAEH